MSYTIKIKEEITNIKNTKSEMIAELSGYIRNNGYVENNSLNIMSENIKIIERLKSFFLTLYEVLPKEHITNSTNFSKNNLYVLTIEDRLGFILKDIGYYDNENNYLPSPPTYIVGANEEIRAYLRGSFLAIGSVNDPKKSRYHLELLVSKPNESVFIQKLLNIFDLNAKILTRNKGYMIYIKEAEKISDYLKLLQANQAVLYFENARIYREKKNQTNRLNNCEQANIDRIFATAANQLEQIKIIEENAGLDLLDDKTKQALEYRRKYPESSLKELSEIISIETGKKITKSGLNHRFRKIKELAEKFTN